MAKIKQPLYHFFNTFANMYVMWQERKIVKCLIKYHSNPSLDLNSHIKAIKNGVERGSFFQYAIKKIHKTDSGDEITEETRIPWQKVRYVVDECIEDEYLKEVARGTRSYLLITSKGKKLARWQYFYFKYILEEFGDLKIIIGTILVTVISSPLWSPIIAHLWAFLKKNF